MRAGAYGIQHALAAARRRGRRLSSPVLPESPQRQRIAPVGRPPLPGVVGGVDQALPEVFRDAAVVYDEGGSDSAVFTVLFVVVDLDDSDTAPVSERDRLTVADRVARVGDDRYFST